MTRLLLDSNLWRYLADANAVEAVERCAFDGNHEICVAPILVFEARELQDAPTRRKILGQLARPTWIRLMPETFLEAQEIKGVIRRLRPQWTIASPNLDEQRSLELDWHRTDGGFWERVAQDVVPVETEESQRLGQEHALARDESTAIRKRVLSRKRILPAAVHLRSAYGVPPPGLPGSTGDPVEYWRVPSLHHIRTELSVYTSPLREWIDAEVDITAIFESPESLTRLWYYEIQALDTPRQWIRGCFEFLQAFHKVTSGNPADSALSSHLVDVDVLVSADRNFVRFVNKCRSDAPFPLAEAHLVEGGPAAVPNLVRFLAERAG